MQCNSQLIFASYLFVFLEFVGFCRRNAPSCSGSLNWACCSTVIGSPIEMCKVLPRFLKTSAGSRSDLAGQQACPRKSHHQLLPSWKYIGITGTLARAIICRIEGCQGRSCKPLRSVDLLIAPAGKNPTGFPSRSCLIACLMPLTDTARFSGSLLAQASTAMKLGRMALILLRIMLTMTLYSGL